MTTTEQQRLDEIADNAAHDCTNQIVRLHELLSGVQPSPIVIKSKVKSWMNQFITEALAPVLKERDELKKSERRLKVLRELMGYVQAGEGETVHLFQDDVPTYTYHITVGKTSYWGDSFNEVIDKADAALNPTPIKETT